MMKCKDSLTVKYAGNPCFISTPKGKREGVLQMQQRIYLDQDWFYSDELTADTPVRLPHTVQETPLHYFDEQAYQKVATYSRVLSVPEEWKGKDLLLTFEGVAHSAEVYVNGDKAAEHHCGYTAFTVNLAKYVTYGADNRIMVKVDSREEQNIPPFGFVIDYMTYGGIYRDVYLEVKEKAHIRDVFVSGNMRGEIRLQISATKPALGMTLVSEVYPVEKGGVQDQGVKTTLGQTVFAPSGNKNNMLFYYSMKDVAVWSPETPNLYLLRVLLKSGDTILDEKWVRFGFRTAIFRSDGFYLNGKKYKIRGLNRHQSYPYVGYAMPENPQRNDAVLLKKELGLNAVRTSHYPQSHYFLDACDELGLLVFTELPGWQHIGDDAWKDRAVQNVKDMVRQYRNHTSIILWGVRINESVDDDAFYRRTNKAARVLDPTRQTGGVRCYKKSHLFEDVYTYNDFVHSGDNQGCDKKSAVTSDMGKAYLISEYMGHMFPTKAFDWEEHRLEDAIRHANVLNEVGKQTDIAGGFGWCMFDYNTHKDFGSGDRICYHGVMDMFRNEKLAAYVYAEMQDEVPVLELSSSMDIGEHPGCNRNETYIFTNADSVRMYKNDHLIKEYRHEATQFPYLKNPPIRIDDYIGDLLEKGENMPAAQAKDVKEILNEVAKFGLYKMSRTTYLKVLKLMAVYHMKMDDAVALYNKYIGDWGGAATTYRFEAVKDGKVVKELRKAPMTKVNLQILTDHTTLQETHTYDVACIRFRAVDENGNLLNYYNDPLVLQLTGAAELIGPAVIGLSGGMGGTYVRTVGESGKAELRVTDGAGNLLGCVEFQTEILGEA